MINLEECHFPKAANCPDYSEALHREPRGLVHRERYRGVMTRIQTRSGTGMEYSQARPVAMFGLFGLAALFTGLAACAPQAPSNPAATGTDTASLVTLRTEIRDQVTDVTCTDPGQCRIIPFGAKPCRGPWAYLIYSVATTDSGRLARSVERYTAREHERNRSEGRASDCLLVTEPEVTCASGRCVRVDSAATAAPWMR